MGTHEKIKQFSSLHGKVLVLLLADLHVLLSQPDDVLVVAIDVVSETPQPLVVNLGTVDPHHKDDRGRRCPHHL